MKNGWFFGLVAVLGLSACTEFQLVDEAVQEEEPATATSEPQESQPPQRSFEKALDAASERLAGAQTKTSRAMRELQVEAGGGPALLNDGQWSEKADSVMEAGQELEGKDAKELLKALEQLRKELEESDWTGEEEQDLNRARRVAEAEQLLARIFIHLADEMGATEPDPPETKNQARKKALKDFVQSPLPNEHIKGLEPADPTYKGLKKAKKRYEEIAKAGGFKPLPDSFKGLKPGKKDARIAELRARLAQDDPELNPVGDTWDEGLTKALIRIRIANQLPVTRGKKKPKKLLDKALRKKLSTPAKKRAKKLKRNIKRWRKSPLRDHPYKVVINLPAYYGEVLDHDTPVHRFKVIIGNTKKKKRKMINATPRIHSFIKTIVFNPYWTVPPRIFEDEIRPSAEKKASESEDDKTMEEVLEEKGFELLGKNPEKPIVRMKPGPRNALGRIKFLFENRHFVYLHDTPNKRLFLRIKRPFSHGCIRVHQPKLLAEILLTHDGTWELAQSKRVFSNYRETPISLKSPIPIIIEYFTATADPKGLVHWHEDIYGKDKGFN
jgi:murein L,D-transpeptidase YcbB/YkuD